MRRLRWALAQMVYREHKGRRGQVHSIYELLYEISKKYGDDFGLEPSEEAAEALGEWHSALDSPLTVPLLTETWQRRVEALLQDRDNCPEPGLSGPLAPFAQDCDVFIFGSTHYPLELYRCSRPAPLLWHLGPARELAFHPHGMAIVGSRSATAYGLRVAADLATLLATLKLPVISGLAMGIDSAAQWAALKSGGSVVGVMPGGLNHPYPHCSWELYRELAKRGLLLALFPPDEKVQRWHFPLRNHLIAGLAAETYVIEGARHSGSLLTAHAALEMGKEIWAVPGSIYQESARAGNGLIADGAHPLFDFAALETYLRAHHVTEPLAEKTSKDPENLMSELDISPEGLAEVKAMLFFIAEENQCFRTFQERRDLSQEGLRELLGFAMATGLIENLGGKFVLTARGLSVIY